MSFKVASVMYKKDKKNKHKVDIALVHLEDKATKRKVPFVPASADDLPKEIVYILRPCPGVNECHEKPGHKHFKAAALLAIGSTHISCLIKYLLIIKSIDECFSLLFIRK